MPGAKPYVVASLPTKLNLTTHELDNVDRLPHAFFASSSSKPPCGEPLFGGTGLDTVSSCRVYATPREGNAHFRAGRNPWGDEADNIELRLWEAMPANSISHPEARSTIPFAVGLPERREKRGMAAMARKNAGNCQRYQDPSAALRIIAHADFGQLRLTRSLAGVQPAACFGILCRRGMGFCRRWGVRREAGWLKRPGMAASDTIRAEIEAFAAGWPRNLGRSTKRTAWAGSTRSRRGRGGYLHVRNLAC